MWLNRLWEIDELHYKAGCDLQFTVEEIYVQVNGNNYINVASIYYMIYNIVIYIV